VRAEISILPVAHKGSPNQPGYRVRLDGIEVGAGWHRTDLALRKEYVSLSPSRGRSSCLAFCRKFYRFVEIMASADKSSRAP
jgi:hypothetical protein